MADRRNVALATARGGFLLANLGCGAYEIHTLFWPAQTKADALETEAAAADAQLWMFCNTDCTRLLTKAPHSNRRARALAMRMGLAPLCTVDAGPAVEMVGPFDLLTLDLQRWALGATGLEDCGLGREGAPLAWRRATGALFAMLLAGQREKALDWFNVWAMAAGFPAAFVEGDGPLVLSVAGQRLQFAGGMMEAL
jgi:hypothetical protein